MTTAGVTGVVTAGPEPVAKNAGKSLSFASLYRAVAEAEATAPDDGSPLGPKPARVRRPEDPLTAEGSTCANGSRHTPTRTPEAPVNDPQSVHAQEYAKVYDELLGAAARLDMLRHLEGGGVDAHATAAMHAVRFAATILWPTVPNTSPPGYRHDSERLLQLTANWREAALELGEFAPERPALRLVSDTTPTEGD
ncbi:hypothetical protein [Streptomyces anulatus]